jgi:hypothetical protein
MAAHHPLMTQHGRPYISSPTLPPFSVLFPPNLSFSTTSFSNQAGGSPPPQSAPVHIGLPRIYSRARLLYSI